MRMHETTLTQGNIANGHIYITSFKEQLPEDVFGESTRAFSASKKIKLEFGCLVDLTDIPRDRHFFRNRAFASELFKQARVREGDVIIFEELSPYHFKISIRWPCGAILTRPG